MTNDSIYKIYPDSYKNTSQVDFSDTDIFKNQIRSIWDAGGKDTLDASAYSENVFLSLQEGTNSVVNDDDDYDVMKFGTVVGIAFNTVIENAIGGSGNDTLIGNDVANILDGGQGDDKLSGGKDSDTYVFKGQFGRDTIQDSDGLGHIEIDGFNLTGIKTNPIPQSGGEAWLAQSAAGTWQMELVKSTDSDTGLVLNINKYTTFGVDRSNSITIDNFNAVLAKSESGYLGITLDATKKIAIVDNNESTDGSNYWSQVNTDISQLSGKSSDMIENGGKIFTLFLNQAAHTADSIQLHLSESSDKFKIRLGNSSITADGAVIPLTEGQTQISVALFEEGDISGDISTTLNATYSGAEGSATSNGWGIQVHDTGVNSHTFNGDYNVATIPTDFDIDVRYDNNDNSVIYTIPAGTPHYFPDGNFNLKEGNGPLVIDNTIFGTSGIDKINGLTGNDLLSGGDGNDKIDGGVGDDMIGGGLGSDYIIGGDGNDYISSSANVNRGHQQISATDQIFNWGVLAGKAVLDHGAVWAVYLNDQEKMIWMGMDNPLTTNTDNDVVDAGAGNDHVIGSFGDDHLMGGTGDDQLDGLGGNDILEGGDGDDILIGDSSKNTTSWTYTDPSTHGVDFLDGGDGNDKLYGDGGNDTLLGGAGDDVLEGGAGNDLLTGSDGSDTYVFNLGDGMDTIDNTDFSQNSTDTLQFGTGINETNILVSRAGDDLQITITENSDSIRIQGYYSTGIFDKKIDTIIFDNGVVWNQTQLENLIDFPYREGGYDELHPPPPPLPPPPPPDYPEPPPPPPDYPEEEYVPPPLVATSYPEEEYVPPFLSLAPLSTREILELIGIANAQGVSKIPSFG